jgi:hypothetical protein
MTVPPCRDDITSKSKSIVALSATRLVLRETIFSIYAGSDRVSTGFTLCRPAVHNGRIHDPEIEE